VFHREGQEHSCFKRFDEGSLKKFKSALRPPPQVRVYVRSSEPDFVFVNRRELPVPCDPPELRCNSLK